MVNDPAENFEFQNILASLKTLMEDAVIYGLLYYTTSSFAECQKSPKL